MTVSLRRLIIMLVFVFVLVGCSGTGEFLNDITSCQVDENRDLPQSENISCITAFHVGSNEVQVGHFGSDVRFAPDSNRLYTFASLVQEWDIAADTELGDCRQSDCFLIDSVGLLHTHSQEGFIGFSFYGDLYPELTGQGEPFLTSKNEKIEYIEGSDMYALYNAEIIRFYDRHSAQFAFDLSFEPFEIEAIAGSPTSYAIAFSNAPVIFIMLTDNETDGVVFKGHEAPVTQLQYSPDGSLIGSLDKTGMFIVWSAADGNEVWRHQYEPDQFFADNLGDKYKPSIDFAISPDNKILIINGITGKNVTFWSLISGEAIAEFDAKSVTELAISPDGTKLAYTTSTKGVYNSSFIPPTRTHNPKMNRNSQDSLVNGSVIVLDISKIQP